MGYTCRSLVVFAFASTIAYRVYHLIVGGAPTPHADEAGIRAANACAKVTDENWREASWSAGLGSSSQEICQSRIRDYVYNGLGRDEGIRPCKFIGLPKFCRLSDRSITAYEIYGYHTVFLDVTGKDNVERVQSHVVWLADPVPESLP